MRRMTMSTVGEILEVRCDDIDILGQGVCKTGGPVIFVPGLIDGEKALVELVEIKKRHAKAVIRTLIEKSPERVSGTPSLQSTDMAHISPERRMRWQTEKTIEAFSRTAGLDITPGDVITDHRETHYRNKSVFHVIKGSVITLGLYAFMNAGLVRTDSFVLSDAMTNTVIKTINEGEIPSGRGLIRHVVVRTNEHGEALVTLVTSDPGDAPVGALVRLISAVDGVVGVMANIHHDRNMIMKGRSKVLWGDNALTATSGDVRIMLSDTAFFQVNTGVARLAYEMIRSALHTSHSAIDAYSGVGSIGFALHRDVDKIVMVDASQENVRLARRTAMEHGLSGISAVRERFETMEWPEADTLIVDPPRNGLMPGAVEKIVAHPFQTMVYLSCDLGTLARDVSRLKEVYRVKAVYPVLMFPGTSSVETLTILERK
jgi:23S rRNA (uracil1939-C5)-methyltransferase